MEPEEGAARWELTVDAAMAAAASARAALVSWLEAKGADPVVVGEMAVVISELVSNAVRASVPGTRPTVTAWVADGEVFLEVSNTVSTDAVERTDWNLDDPLRGGGRGLLLVRAFVDDLEVEPDMSIEGVVVRCRRPLR